MPDLDLISDLHLDMRKNAIRMLMDIDPTSNTLVLAGDLCEARNLNPQWLQVLSEKYKTILYIPGNHEFYGSTYQQTMKILRDAMPNNWQMLYNQCLMIKEHMTVAGTTLWFPDTPHTFFYERDMADFTYIVDFKEWVYKEHNQAKTFLARSFGDVWVTHHLPAWRSVHPKYEGSNLNRFFVGDLTNELQTCTVPPSIIVHGHTHEPCDYMLGDTRVVCNPLGYPQEGNHSIIPVKVAWNA